MIILPHATRVACPACLRLPGRLYGISAALVLALLAAASLLTWPIPAEAYHCPTGGDEYGGSYSDVAPEDYATVMHVSETNIQWISGWWYKYFGWYFHPNSLMSMPWWNGAIHNAFGFGMAYCGSYDENIKLAYAASDIVRAAGLGWVADAMSWTEAQAILSRYADHGQVPASVYKDVAVAVKYGIIQVNGQYLYPQQELTRIQAARLIARTAVARLSGPKTRFHLAEFIALNGTPHTPTYWQAISDTIAIYRDDGTRVWGASGRSVSVLGGSIGVGRFYGRYSFISRSLYSWDNGLQVTWTSVPFVFEVYNNAPSAAIHAPQDGSSVADDRPEFRFSATDPDRDSIGGFHIQVSTRSDFASVTWEGYINTPAASGEQVSVRPDQALPRGQPLYARVRARDSWGAWGPWSAVVSFRIEDQLRLTLSASPNPVRRYELLRVRVRLDSSSGTPSNASVSVTFNGKGVPVSLVSWGNGWAVWEGTYVPTEQQGRSYPLVASATWNNQSASASMDVLVNGEVMPYVRPAILR